MSFLVNRSHRESFSTPVSGASNDSFSHCCPSAPHSEKKFRISEMRSTIKRPNRIGALIERELVLSVSVSGVGACLQELSGVVSGLERAEPRIIRISSVHCGSFHRGLMTKCVLPGQPQSLGEFLTQRKLFRTTPSDTAAQVPSVRKRSFVFQR
ncbi:hypothetical protein CDAR_551441 [Caerostris darwini]|uniref:Uncharacterized protein n=1 Tax=Caerostris darwini TaxID=1538125 RepID=A0AAV4V6E8_9ARAC|nr:hypothetical protein CDAR_551441 [Caerostris darwini]